MSLTMFLEERGERGGGKETVARERERKRTRGKMQGCGSESLMACLFVCVWVVSEGF